MNPSLPETVIAEPGRAHVFPRFCVAFLACKTLDKPAATYLILAQNSFQNIFEFEVIDIDGLSISYKLELPVRDLLSTAHDYVEWVQHSIKAFCTGINAVVASWNVQGVEDCYWIVISEAPMPENFYGDSAPGLTIISIADWKRKMAPPSVLEFILRQTHVGVLNYCDIGQSHIETRGCISDFNASLTDARQHVLLGLLCSTCATKIEANLGASAVISLRLLLSRSWLGNISQAESVAGVLKKVFGYDLYLTKGLSPNWLETALGEMVKTLPQESIKGVFYVVLAWLLFRSGLKAK